MIDILLCIVLLYVLFLIVLYILGLISEIFNWKCKDKIYKFEKRFF